MLNRRIHQRKKSSTPATLVSGAIETPVTILDLSSRGARIQVEGSVFLSPECLLKSSRFAAPVPSKIVWRRRAEIGLMFRVAMQERAAQPLRPAFGKAARR